MYIVITDLVQDADATPWNYTPNPMYFGPFVTHTDANDWVKKQPEKEDYYEFYYKIVPLNTPK
jgi:hypothetical protein